MRAIPDRVTTPAFFYIPPFFLPSTAPSSTVPCSCLTNRRRRDTVDSAAELVAVWLEELAGHWELQPDKNEIHMSFPDAKVTELDI